MISRRQFLAGASAAAGAACMAGGERSVAHQAAQGPIPTSLAALKSMKDQAWPITREERQARIGKALRLMRRHKLDAVMVGGGTSLEEPFGTVKA